MRLQGTVDESSDFCWMFSYFFRGMIFRYHFHIFSSARDIFFRSATSSLLSFVMYVFIFKNPLHTIQRNAKFSTNSSLGMALFVQKCYFMPVTLCYLLHFFIDSTEEMAANDMFFV